jgi:hypothetical protein
VGPPSQPLCAPGDGTEEQKTSATTGTWSSAAEGEVEERGGRRPQGDPPELRLPAEAAEEAVVAVEDAPQPCRTDTPLPRTAGAPLPSRRGHPPPPPPRCAANPPLAQSRVGREGGTEGGREDDADPPWRTSICAHGRELDLRRLAPAPFVFRLEEERRGSPAPARWPRAPRDLHR